MKKESRRIDYICLDSWAGRQEIPCTVLRRTPKRYVVRLEADCLKGVKGSTLNVPVSAMKIVPPPQ